jgi:SAM-dependent methyltransferase
MKTLLATGPVPCPMCSTLERKCRGLANGVLLAECARCGLLFAANPPTDLELAAIYTAAYTGIGLAEPEKWRLVFAMKKATFETRLRLLETIRLPGKVLDVGCGSGAFLRSAAERGWQPLGVEPYGPAAQSAAEASGVAVFAGPLEQLRVEPHTFDVAHLSDVIEHLSDPRLALRHVRRILKPDGLLLITTCDSGSLSARLLGRHWPNYKREHLLFPDRRTIRRLLTLEGFRVVTIRPAVKALSLSFACDYFRMYGPAVFARAARALRAVLPSRVHYANWFVPAGDMLVLAVTLPG